MDVLANWMWQGGAVAVAATIILRASRRMSATTRYNLWWITLAVVLALPIVSWLSAIAASFRQDATAVYQVVSAPGRIANAPAPAGIVLPTPPAWLAPQLVLVWLAWLVVSIGRMLGACISLRRVSARPVLFRRGGSNGSSLASRLVHSGRRADARAVGLTSAPLQCLGLPRPRLPSLRARSRRSTITSSIRSSFTSGRTCSGGTTSHG